MNFLEKDLEQIIYDTPNVDLQKRGLDISGKKFRQTILDPYGKSDILTIQRPFFDFSNPIITIWEFKKDIIDVGTFLQAVRYAKGISLHIADRMFCDDFKIDYEIAIVGKSIDLKGAFCFLPDIFPNISLYTYSYEFDGIKFKKESGYYIKAT